MDPTVANPKKELLLKVLESSWAYLHVDGRVDGVALPEWLRQPSVTLQIGYDMPVPIFDLEIDDEGVSCTLSFRQTPHACKVPWGAVFAITDMNEKGVLFPEDVPVELRPSLRPVEIGGTARSDASAALPASDDSNGSDHRDDIKDAKDAETSAPAPSRATRPDRKFQPRPAPRPAPLPAREPALAPDAAGTGSGSDEEAAIPRFKSGRPRPSHLKLV